MPQVPRIGWSDGGTAKQRGAREARWDSLWLTLVYVLMSVAWVLFSDQALRGLGLPPDVELLVASSKGVLFVLATGAVLYLVSVTRLAQLYSSRVRSARLFERSAEGLLIMRVVRGHDDEVRDFVISDVNPVLAERLSLSRNDLIGQSSSKFDRENRRLRAYFEVVAEGVRIDETARSEADFGDDTYELLVAYPIEMDLWIVAAMDVSALREAQLQLRRQEERIRQAYVDVLDAVTGGKLVVMTEDELQEELGDPLTERLPLKTPAALADARHVIRDAVAQRSPALSESTELLSAVGEALNNALKHANGGAYRVFARDGRLQVCVSDSGPGIDFRTLPKATLVPGFSTASTLGMGFTIMLQLSDRVLLSTRPGQTEVVLEMKAA